MNQTPDYEMGHVVSLPESKLKASSRPDSMFRINKDLIDDNFRTAHRDI